MSDTYFRAKEFHRLPKKDQLLLGMSVRPPRGELLEDLLYRLELLKPCAGCVPQELVGDDLLRTIQEKFELLGDRAAFEFECRHPSASVSFVTSPSWDADTVMVFYDPGRWMLLHEFRLEAWNLNCTTLGDVVERVRSLADALEEGWNRH